MSVTPAPGARRLFDRILVRLRPITVEINVLPKWRRVNTAIKAAPNPAGRPTLARSLVVALRACEIEAASEARSTAYQLRETAARRVRGAEGADDEYRERHEFTRRHAPGQLQALLVFGYCRLSGFPLTEHRLEPLAVPIIRTTRLALNRVGPPSFELDEFSKWLASIRRTLDRMGNRAADAERAIDMVDQHLAKAALRAQGRQPPD
jgi:hypothetical protein